MLDSEGVEWCVCGYHHYWDEVYMDMVGWSIWNWFCQNGITIKVQAIYPKAGRTFGVIWM